MINIAVIGTFDTKKAEFEYLINRIHENGMGTITVDLSTFNSSYTQADYSQKCVAEAAGYSIEDIRDRMSHADSLKAMGLGGKNIAKTLMDEKKIHGVISMGGSQGTFLAVQFMSAFPVGFPKVLVSTVSGHSALCGMFEGIKDAFIVNPIVDIAGMNGLLKKVMDSAAAAVCGMANDYKNKCTVDKKRPKRIGLTMWGVTTPCVNHMSEVFKKKGYETYVFHANGMGDKAMEQLIEDHEFTAVADITTCQLANTLAGAFSEPVPDRMKIYAKTDIPLVVSVGGMDMLAMIDPSDRLPEKFKGRKEYLHGGDSLFVRSTVDENIVFARVMAERLNNHKGPVRVLLPLFGISANDKEGEVLYDPAADAALFDTLEKELRDEIRVIKVNAHINDEKFADAAAMALMEMIDQ